MSLRVVGTEKIPMFETVHIYYSLVEYRKTYIYRHDNEQIYKERELSHSRGIPPVYKRSKEIGFVRYL